MKYNKTVLSMILLPFAVVHAGQGTVEVSVTLRPAGSFIAKSSDLAIKGYAKKSGEVLQAKDIVIPLNTLKTGIDLRDRHMREKYFETQKFPQAILKEATGKNGKFTGTLVVRDVAKAVTGTYAVESGNFIAKFRCKVSDFKIQAPKYMGVGVQDEVDVEVAIPVGTPSASAK